MQTTMARPAPSICGEGGRRFCTTQWSLVLEAGRPNRSASSSEALERLCQSYWPPIYACIRQGGRSREESEDLTQDFFASLLRYGSLSGLAPEKGRFRAFLRASLNHLLSNRWHRDRAAKRGGGRPALSLDAVPSLEEQISAPATGLSPEKAFDQAWARTLLGRVVDRLQREYESGGQAERFAVLKGYLPAGSAPAPYLESAQALGLSEAAVKSAIYKLRRRYGEMLRAEIARTLSDPSEVEDEIRHLLAALTE